MQYFHISWLKQISEKQEKINLLIKWNDENSIKNILKSYWIVVFSVNPFSDSPETIWKVNFKFDHDWEIIEWVLWEEKVKDWFFILEKSWFDLTYINNLANPISDEQVENVLNKLKKDLDEKESTIEVWKKWKSYKIYDEKFSEKDILNVRSIADETIKDFENLKSNVWDRISVSEIKELDNLVQELKKYKLWNNVEKISYILDSLLTKMEQIEMKFLDIMKKEENVTVWSEVISELDFVLEYEKYKKSQKIKKMWNLINTTQTTDDKYYTFLWKAWIYLKFFVKEIKFRLNNYKSLINNSFIFIEVLLIFLILELIFYNIYLSLVWEWVDSIYYYLYNIWLLWFIFFIIKTIKNLNNNIKSNPLLNIILIFVWFLLFYVLSSILFNTFAL